MALAGETSVTEELPPGRFPHSGFSPGEEIAHAVIHGIGAVTSIAGLIVLVSLAAMYGGALHVITCAVFGAALTLTYVASTLYHAWPVSRHRIKNRLQVLDHCSIYVLIAGTYTPVLLVLLGGTLGWTLLVLVWVVAILGIVLKMTPSFRDRQSLSLVSYLGCGWLALIAIKPLVTALEAGALWLILAGGIIYTVGVIFYCWDRLAYNHVIWHLFVLAGSTLHFLAVLLYVIP